MIPYLMRILRQREKFSVKCCPKYSFLSAGFFQIQSLKIFAVEDSKFFKSPILNSPYEYPGQHWELDESGQPTERIINTRRRAEFIAPIPKTKKQRQSKSQQLSLEMGEGDEISTQHQRYQPSEFINKIRREVEDWRRLPNPHTWQVTPETQRLLQHWRHHAFSGPRPFFCQVEAVETLIWLTEVAPNSKSGKAILDYLENARQNANPELLRIALKLATGAGKTTVMAMVIAWQTINAVRRESSKKFTRGFLIVTPGLTIRDRLRVLLPSDADNYYSSREIVPSDMLEDVRKAKIIITNYHSFKLRERMDVSKGTKSLLIGRQGEDLLTKENESQMIQRVMPELMGMKNILVLNDEAHHCYRQKPEPEDDEKLSPEEKEEAEQNSKAAKLWISGIETINKVLGVQRVVDLSATPFFLSGSGYREGTLFPWVVSDFSLMDAIECGIVKLPRVPIADNLQGEEPMYRNLWVHISKKMPKKGKVKGVDLDPDELPTQLKTALDALYGHYKETYEVWEKSGMKIPPCFIIVCHNTAASKLVYDYISGYHRDRFFQGQFELFRNYDEHGNTLSKPRTLLIDSHQLESGEALDDNFLEAAKDEIEVFKREIIERTGDRRKAEDLGNEEILREVMNTVGRPDRLGASIRCVVSVSMLTEGWDTNTVTHVLGVRAFGTQLLCEQVIGRALRRQSYELNEQGLFNVEYADVLGIPFDFNAKPVISKPTTPKETIQVKAVRPERDALEISFPNVKGFMVELPEEQLEADFNEDSYLELTPNLIGATETKNSGIIGEGIDLTLEHTKETRRSAILFRLTNHILLTKWRSAGDDAPLYLFGYLKPLVNLWIEKYLKCTGGTYEAQLQYRSIADMASDKIVAGINRKFKESRPILALTDPFNPTGSTNHVNFNTSKTDRWETASNKCHVNYVILDSDWEAEFCRVAENHPRVICYVKNHNLGFEVPYRFGSDLRKYRPDFIVKIDDGNGAEDPLNLVVEIKGFQGQDSINKRETMNTYWVPGVNNTRAFGRWAFAEFNNVFTIGSEFGKVVEAHFEEMLNSIPELENQ